jgi:hypothetical protein
VVVVVAAVVLVELVVVLAAPVPVSLLYFVQYSHIDSATKFDID